MIAWRVANNECLEGLVDIIDVREGRTANHSVALAESRMVRNYFVIITPSLCNLNFETRERSKSSVVQSVVKKEEKRSKKGDKKESKKDKKKKEKVMFMFHFFTSNHVLPNSSTTAKYVSAE